MAADPRSPAARAQLADATSGCRSWLHPPQCPGGRAYGSGRDLGRSRDHAGAGQRAQRAHGSHLFHARLAAAMRGTQAGAGAGRCARGPAAHRCRADLAQSLRSSRPRQREGAGTASGRGAALPRALGAETVDGAARHRPGRGTRLVGSTCACRRGISIDPRTALVGPQPERPQLHPVGRLGGIGRGFSLVLHRRHGLQPGLHRYAAKAGARATRRSGAAASTWRSSPSALVCRAGS